MTNDKAPKPREIMTSDCLNLMCPEFDRVCVQRDALEEKLRAAEARCREIQDSMKKHYSKLFADHQANHSRFLADLTAKLKLAESALGKFGTHRGLCNIIVEAPCTCGLTDALAKIRGEK